jgi:hypothetical protein
VINIVLVLKSGRKAGSYLLASALLVNVLSIYANNVDNADNVDDADDANDVDDVDDVDDDADDADLAKTLLPTGTICIGRLHRKIGPAKKIVIYRDYTGRHQRGLLWPCG